MRNIKTSSLSEKKRNSIIKNATKLFLNKGFGATGMDVISKTAGVSKRTLYKHFPSKKVLFREIVIIEWQKVAYWKPDDIDTLDYVEIFTNIMKHTLKVLYSPRMYKLQRLVISESAKFPELQTLHAEYGIEPLFDRFRKYVQFLGETGVLDIDDSGLATTQYIGLIKEYVYWPWFFGMKSKPTPEHEDEVIKSANEIFFSFYAKNRK